MSVLQRAHVCSSNNYEAPESSGREKEGFGNMMKRVGSGALSPKGIINMVSAKSSELRHGSKGQSILDDSVGLPFWFSPFLPSLVFTISASVPLPNTYDPRLRVHGSSVEEEV